MESDVRETPDAIEVILREGELRAQRTVALLGLSMAGIVNIALLFLIPEHRLRWLLVFLVFACGTLLLLFGSRTKLGRSASVTYAVLLLLLVLALGLRGSGTASPAFWGLILIPLVAGLLLNRQAAIIAAAASIVAGLVIAVLESRGAVGAVQVSHTPYTLWLVNVMYIGLAMGLQRLTLGDATQALRRATRELSERRKAESDLRSLTRRFDIAADAGRVAVWDFDLVTNAVLGDARFADIYGLGRNAPVSLDAGTWLAMIHPDDRAVVERGGGAGRAEFRILRSDSGIRYIHAAWSTVHNAQGTPIRMVGVNIDITAEKKAEAERDKLVRSLAERIKELTLLHQTARLLQSERPPDQLLLQELVELVPQGWQYPEICEARITFGGLEVRTSGWHETSWKQWAALQAGPESGVVEVAYTEPMPAEAEGPFLREERALLDSLAEMLSTYLEHHRSAEALRRREEEFRVMFQSAAIGIALVDISGRPISCNPALQRFLGYSTEELNSKRFSDFTHPDDVAEDLEQFATLLAGARESYQLEKRYIRKDGETAWGKLTVSTVRGERGEVRFCVAMVEDVTGAKRAAEERERLEAQFRQSQKMEALGLLAGGVAHDFNNLITIIGGYSEMLLRRASGSSDEYGMIREIRDAGERARSLARQLLTFSRRAVFESEVLDANILIREMERMLSRLIGEDIVLATDLAQDLGRVKVDRGQLEQALINLVVNARDAMPTGGRITIGTKNLDIEHSAAETTNQGRPGYYVAIAVNDTGEGMSAETKAQIFEPFFTTKEKGRGTGLGLAMVYGFVKQCDGSVSVESAPGRGASFTLLLPQVMDRLSVDRTTPQSVAILTGHERLLLVEDDDAVRALALRLLEECGYSVIAMSRPNLAAALPDEVLSRVALLVTDVVMPELSGRQLADLLRQRVPDLKVLYTSGHTDDAVVRHGVLESNAFFLQKPFTLQSLSRKVRDVLDAG